MHAQVLYEKLEPWYRENARRLPWRLTSDPYKIWISEVMLQQTQSATVIPYYNRFLQRFPTLVDLAKARELEVLRLWSGLGYYSRPKNLHRSARLAATQLGGRVPNTYDQLIKLPGIGQYTAGAILSIAHDLPIPVVDGNIYRVFARLLGERRQIDHPHVKIRFWTMAKKWIHEISSPRIWNQALMELGATVCTKHQPTCQLCPIQDQCIAKKLRIEQTLPRTKKRPKTKHLFLLGLVYDWRGKIFLQHQELGQWWAGLWSIPYRDVPSENRFDSVIKRLLKNIPQVKSYIWLGRHVHTVTHHRIHLTGLRLTFFTKPLLKGKWISPSNLEKLPVSSLTKKVLSELC